MATFMSVLIFAPGALAQHAAKAIQRAAENAGFLRSGEPEHDAKLKTLILAFDPASPMDALQKLVTLARSAPLAANGRGNVSVQQMCSFYDGLKKDPDFINNPEWKSFRSSYGALIDQLLYGHSSTCGAGPVQSMWVQAADRARYVWLNLKDKLNIPFADGVYSTRSKQLRFKLSDKPEDASQILSDYAQTGTNFNKLFQKISDNRVLQNQDAQEVATAMTHIKEGADENDRDKVLRTLATYDTLSILPIDSNDYLLYRGKTSRQNVEIGPIALLSPHGIAAKSGGHEAVPFRKGVAVVRTYQYNGALGIDGRIGQVSMPPTNNNVSPEWKPVVEGTLESVNTLMDNHFNSIKNSGIGLMYGPNSNFAKLDENQKSEFLARSRKPGSAAPVPQETSCIGFVLNQLEQGYKRAGRTDRWKEIDDVVRINNGDGNFLLRELKKDGWTTVYFNPDVKNPNTLVPGASKPADHHVWTASEVKKGRNYLSGVKLPNGDRFEGIPIDKQMINYRLTNPYDYATTTETEEIQKLRDAPLFVGIANGGYHVYLGSQGNVIESHSTRGPTDPTNMEIRPFTEWGLLKGESYLSGVIAVPPGSWDK